MHAGPARNELPVHDLGLFHGQEPIFDAVIHVFGRFHGREPIFELPIHVFGPIHGREPIFDAVIHVFSRFHGREVKINDRHDTDVCYTCVKSVQNQQIWDEKAGGTVSISATRAFPYGGSNLLS